MQQARWRCPAHWANIATAAGLQSYLLTIMHVQEAMARQAFTYAAHKTQISQQACGNTDSLSSTCRKQWQGRLQRMRPT